MTTLSFLCFFSSSSSSSFVYIYFYYMHDISLLWRCVITSFENKVFLFFLSVVYLTHVLPKVYYVFQKLNAENQQIEKSLNNYLYDRLKEQSRTNQNKMFIDVENSTYHSRKYNYTFLLCLNNSPGMEWMDERKLLGRIVLSCFVLFFFLYFERICYCCCCYWFNQHASSSSSSNNNNTINLSKCPCERWI